MAGSFEKVTNRILTRIQLEQEADFIASFTDRRILDAILDENPLKPEDSESAF